MIFAAGADDKSGAGAELCGGDADGECVAGLGVTFQIQMLGQGWGAESQRVGDMGGVDLAPGGVEIVAAADEVIQCVMPAFGEEVVPGEVARVEQMQGLFFQETPDGLFSHEPVIAEVALDVSGICHEGADDGLMEVAAKQLKELDSGLIGIGGAVP